TPYPAAREGVLPDLYKRVLDPLETLTFVAAHTRRIALGTSVLNLPWYPPVLLARRLNTLDVLSGGRPRLGFGLGWFVRGCEAGWMNMRPQALGARNEASTPMK